LLLCFFFSSRRRHTRFSRDWSSDVCSSDLVLALQTGEQGPLQQVMAGVDTAMSDLAARRAGVPLWQLLGGPAEAPPVAVYASGKIGRASCRERGERAVVGGWVETERAGGEG